MTWARAAASCDGPAVLTGSRVMLCVMQARDAGQRIKEVMELDASLRDRYRLFFYISPYKRSRQVGAVPGLNPGSMKQWHHTPRTALA
jgi:hypothetical protein